MRMRILVADSDSYYRSTFVQLLTRRGHEVIEASGVDQAIKMMERLVNQNKVPDLAIIDLHLGDATKGNNHDGITVLERAKSLAIPAFCMYTTPIAMQFFSKTAGPRSVLGAIQKFGDRNVRAKA